VRESSDKQDTGAKAEPSGWEKRRIGRRLATPTLSIVIPLRDEAHSLVPLHEEIDAVLRGMRWPAEIVFVDDGSRDESPRVLDQLQRRDPRVRVLRLARGRGQSAALDAGFRAALGNVIVTLDADGQNDPADLPRMLEALEGADCVNGIRMERRDDPIRLLSSRVANTIRNRITHETVTDVGCSLRVMRAEYVRRIRLFDGMHRFLPTLLRLEGARIVELPVTHRPRRYGRSKYGIANRALRALLDLLAVRWMQARTLHYECREIERAKPEKRGSGEPARAASQDAAKISSPPPAR